MEEEPGNWLHQQRLFRRSSLRAHQFVLLVLEGSGTISWLVQDQPSKEGDSSPVYTQRNQKKRWLSQNKIIERTSTTNSCTGRSGRGNCPRNIHKSPRGS